MGRKKKEVYSYKETNFLYGDKDYDLSKYGSKAVLWAVQKNTIDDKDIDQWNYDQWFEDLISCSKTEDEAVASVVKHLSHPKGKPREEVEKEVREQWRRTVGVKHD